MKRLFFLYLFTFIAVMPLVAQDNALQSLEIVYSQPGNKIADSLAAVTCVLTVKDPSKIGKVHVKAGYQAGGSEVLDQTIAFNEKGKKLQVTGNKIYVALGTLSRESLCYE